MSEMELVERLEKLERSNRRLKGFAVVGLILATAFATITATQPAPQKITAHAFEVIDGSGKVRITLSTPAGIGEGVVGMQPDDPGIWISDKKGVDRFILNENELAFTDESGRASVKLLSLDNGAGLEFLGKKTQKIANLPFPVTRMNLSTWGLYFDDDEGNDTITVGGLSSPGVKGGIPKPVISIRDLQGFEMDLGSTGTVNTKTGATEQSSAASIKMFGNDENHRVIWQAP